MMKTDLEQLLRDALATVIADRGATGVTPPETVILEPPRDAKHGDLATNLALVFAKSLRIAPRPLAEAMLAALPVSQWIDHAEVAGPGFINLFVTPLALQSVVADILKLEGDYGRRPSNSRGRVVVEFVSANPTGPLHVGHGRGAAVGDSLCRLLEAAGWSVTREFYYNDAGVQIDNLIRSVQARAHGIKPGHHDWPERGYCGEYITDVANSYLARETIHADDREITGSGDPTDAEAIRHFAVAYLRREQDSDLRAFGVHFDVYALESSLYSSGEVDSTVRDLVASGHTYEAEGAVWLRSTDFGDDKDRVMRKSDGGYTYFVPDVAYHRNKWRRGFVRAINEQGADHHSTIVRVRAGLQALDAGIPADWPEYVLHQMVTVVRGGQEVKISKRAGDYVTLRDLIDEVGRDATRFFLLLRKSDSQLTFDIDVARARTLDNPVYTIQYAHARICSMFRQLDARGGNFDLETAKSARLDRLVEPQELVVMGLLARYPETADMAAAKLEPHLIPQYLRELAATFHSLYHAHAFLVDDLELRNARMALAWATRQVIASGLSLIGVSTPERM